MLLTIILIVTILGILPISIAFTKDVVKVIQLWGKDTWKELKEYAGNKLDQ